MIAIIDYGVGNLFSLKSSLAHLGQEAVVTADPAVWRKRSANGDTGSSCRAWALLPMQWPSWRRRALYRS